MKDFSIYQFNPQPEPPRPGELTIGNDQAILIGLLLPAVQKVRSV